MKDKLHKIYKGKVIAINLPEPKELTAQQEKELEQIAKQINEMADRLSRKHST